MTFDIEKFADRARELVIPHVTRSYYPEISEGLTGPKLVINVKTGRCGYEGEGTLPPEPEAEEGARTLAAEFGLEYLHFDEIEKGWGLLIFSNPS